MISYAPTENSNIDEVESKHLITDLFDNFDKVKNSNLEQGKLFRETNKGYHQISKIVVPKITEGNRNSGVDSGINSNNGVVNESINEFNQKVSEYDRVSHEYNNLFQEYLESLREDYSTGGEQNVSDKSLELKNQLRSKNDELSEIVVDMNNHIDNILENDANLSASVGNQQQQLRASIAELEKERKGLDDSKNSLDPDTMDGLYNDSVLRKKSMYNNYLAWGFLSAAIIGISLYQIKKLRD